MEIVKFIKTKQAIINIILPILIYSLSFYLLNIDAAIILSAIYTLVIVFIDKKQAKLPILLILISTGSFQYLYSNNLFTLNINNEGVFLAIMNSIVLSFIYILYTLFNYPIIRLFAEMGGFSLPPMNKENKKKWDNISYIWVAIYLIKAIVIYVTNQFIPSETSSLIYILSWPLTVFMVYVSIKYVKTYTFIKNKKIKKIGHP